MSYTSASDPVAVPQRSGATLTQRPPQLMWMAFPIVAFTLVMIAAPLVYAAYLSLTNYAVGRDAVFVGLANYQKMLNDRLFWNGIYVTFVLYVMSLAIQMMLGVYLGMLLNRITVLQRFIRTAFVTPFLMPSVVVGMMWLVVLDPSIGAANYLLQEIGLPPSRWLNSPGLVLPLLSILDTWQWTPFVALLVLGGLQTLPQSAYEAASVDGVSPRQVFLHITLPLLGPTLVTITVLRSVDLLRFFDLIYIMTNGGPGNRSLSLNVYAFQRGIDYFDMGYASALMVTLGIAVLVVVVLLSGLRRWVAW